MGLGLAGVFSLALVSGVLIGCVGIGGVILVPALAYGFGVPVHTAIPAAMAAFLVSGSIGSYAYWRAGSVPWSMARPLFVTATPAAFAGALAASAAPAGVLEALIGLLTAASGLNAWRTGARPSRPGHAVPDSQLLAAGAATGFASALTGTGGPLVLVPILLWLDCPVLAAVGMAQVIQLPIAALATAGNMAAGTLDWRLAGGLGAGLAVGTAAGAAIAHAVPRATLRRIVALVLTLAGAAILARAAIGWLGAD